MLYLRLFHILGVILWIGGVVTVGYAAALASEDAQQGTAGALRKAVLALSTPAMLIAWVAGLWMLFTHWSDVYSKAGWMHAKLTLALIVTGLTGVVTGKLRKAAKGEAELKPGLMRSFAVLILGLSAGVLALAVLKPF